MTETNLTDLCVFLFRLAIKEFKRYLQQVVTVLSCRWLELHVTRALYTTERRRRHTVVPHRVDVDQTRRAVTTGEKLVI